MCSPVARSIVLFDLFSSRQQRQRQTIISDFVIRNVACEQAPTLNPLVLAWVGAGDSAKNVRLLSVPVPSPHLWKEKHIECMIGCGIAMHSAFFVFGSNPLPGFQLNGLLAPVPWSLPTVIGVAAITILIRPERQQHLDSRNKRL